MVANIGVSDPGTIAPLPSELQSSLPIVAALGVVSFVTSFLLFLRLAWQLVRSRREHDAKVNQFVLLIFNLIIADISQAAAFLINAHWLRQDAITVGTSACWAQGWFISTGDLASGAFTFAIALHAFADIVWNFRLSHKPFVMTIAGLWVFVYLCAILGVSLHPNDFYARAGPWCWINSKYTSERLWLHYFWIIVVEFGTVALYTLLVLILNRRVRESFYTESKTAVRAKAAARMIVAYPVVYVVCTLPVVTARLALMAGADVGYVYLCVGGAMITSTGWLDVLLYTLTRSSIVLDRDLPRHDVPVLETFRMPGQNFADPHLHLDHRGFSSPSSSSALSPDGGRGSPGVWSQSPSEHWAVDVKAESVRISQRAAQSVRDLSAGREQPRFFQRIYQYG